MSWSDVGNWVKTYGQNLASEISGGGPAAHKAFTRKPKPGDSSTSAVTGVATNSGMPSSGYGSDADLGSYNKGGKVPKTGMARLHKGEIVLTRSQAKIFSRKKGRK
jgi:hypothetical protein